MSKKISAGIGLDGEKEFRQAVNAINSDLNVLKSEMKKVTSEFIDNEKSMESLNAKQDVYSKQIAAQTNKVATLKEALENAKKEYGENSKQVQAWQIKLNNAEADLNKMNKELADIEKQASGIDKVNDELVETEKAAKGAREETTNLKESTSSFGDVAKTVASTTAAAFAAVGTAISAVAVGMANVSVDSASYADEILTTSTVIRANTEHLQAYAYAAELIDVSMDTMTSSVSKNLKSMSNAVDGSKAYAEAYEKLGINLTYEGQLRESIDVYWEVIDALGEIKDHTERDALAMQILGKSAQDLNPLIEQGSDGMSALTDEAIKMGAVLSHDTLEDLGAFDDSIQRLTAGGTAAKNALGALFAPSLNSLATEGISLLGQFTTGIIEADGDMEKVGDVISETIESAMDIINQQLPEFLDLGADILTGLLQGVSKTLSSSEFSETSKSIIGTLISSITSVLPDLGVGALNIIVALSQGILDNLPELTKSGIEILGTLMLGIADATPELVPSIVSVVEEMVLILSDPETLTSLLTAGLSIITSLGSSLIDAIPQLIDTAFEVIENIATYLLDEDNMLMVANAAISIVTKLGISIIGAIPDLLTNIDTLITDVVDKFGETDWSTIGSEIIEGIKSGITEMWETFTGWVSEKFEGLKTSVKDLFDINSPSRWAKDEIMGNVMLGFGLGIEENEEEVRKQMDDFTATLTDDVEYDLNARNITARIIAAEPPAEILAATYSKTGTSGSDDKFDRMLALLEIIALNSKKDIVLDKKTLVGELAPEINEELGTIYALAERGD